jgi:hypothetical protein
MRPGQQNKRGRGRNNNGGGGGGGGNNFNRKGQNPLTRTYDSSGPDVKIRGTAQHIAEKYAALARDAQSAGDRVMAENYLQHAEHYNRIIAAAQSQMQERFQRDDRDNGDDRQDYNDRDGEDFDGSDDAVVQASERPQQPAQQPQQHNRQQQHERRQREPREPREPREHQPQPVVEIAGTGPQPVIEDMPAEAVVAAAESQAEAGGERQPRRRNAGNRPRRQPRRSAASDEGDGGDAEAGEAPVLAEAASE